MAVSKSKEHKKEGGKTNRRSKIATTTNQKPAAPPTKSDGQTPGELADALSKQKNRAPMHDIMKNATVITAEHFQKNISDNLRMPIPIRDNKKLKLSAEDEYFHGQYMKTENFEYTVAQAPTRNNYRQIWQAIFRDTVKVAVCLCHDDEMSTSDDSKCFQYFPTEPNQVMEVDQKYKGKYIITCKSREELSMGAMKYLFQIVDTEAVPDVSGDLPNAPRTTDRELVFFHFNTWNGLKPDGGNPMEQAGNVALFCREVCKAEIDVIRKCMDNYVAPVFIQSFDAFFRGPLLWVVLMLCRDVEKRECFDVPFLIKSAMKLRPGCFSSYYHFAFCFAVCLHIGKEVKWCENDCANALNDLSTKFADRKTNELGQFNFR